MDSIFLILATISGFYFIFKSIKSIDKIYSITRNGYRTKAIVTSINEKKNTDGDGDTTYTYFYFVKFRDKRGKEIEKKIDFPITNRGKRNPPFSISIIYVVDDNNNYSVILKNNKGRNSSFYFSLIIGFGFLTYVILKQDGEFEIIINFFKKIIK